jgi:hypothetical protein
MKVSYPGGRTKRTDGHTPYKRVCPSGVPSIVLVRLKGNNPRGSFFHYLFRGVHPIRETVLFRTRDQTKRGQDQLPYEYQTRSLVPMPKPVHHIPRSLLQRSFFQNPLHCPCKGLS